MGKTRLIRSTLAGGLVLSGVCLDVAIGGACPPINLDSRGSPTLRVNEEVVSFSFRSKTYPVSVLSAFTTQAASRVSNPNYCIRYEVENKSHQDAIEKFYWPMAGLQVDTINPHQRISLAATKPPGREPSIEETWLYAFLNATARTYAFQSRAELSSGYKIIRAALQIEDSPKRSKEIRGGREEYAAIDAVQQQLVFKEPATYDEVGAEFTSGDSSEVSSKSLASWNGENSQITVLFTRTDEKTSVSAPVTYALSKAGDASDLLSLVREFVRKPVNLSFKDNKFELSRRVFPAEFADSRALYVIEQPVTLATSNGFVCFLAPMYSPIPIPADLLKCRLF